MKLYQKPLNYKTSKIIFSLNIKSLYKHSLLAFFILLTFSCFAQSPYTDSVYHPEIKSVEFYNTKKQASFPLITLNSGDKVMLDFDNLQGGSIEYSYTIEHCDADWNSSNLSTAEYMKNYSEDKIVDFSYSIGTYQKYTHYDITIPNENIAPKIPGNYILKVYEDGDQAKLVITRRLYVLSPKVSISAEMIPSNDNSTRQTNQKINFTINYGNLPVQNPATNLRTLIMQNARSETGIFNAQPTYIRGNQLIFSDVTQNDFPGGNEFRHFDTRSLKVSTEHILHIAHDTSNSIIMVTDQDLSQPNYTFQYDLNGNFYILNQDGTDLRTDADYAHLYFTLSTKRSAADGTPYLVGQFNNYKLDNSSKMHFDAASGKFASLQYLKQGVYDYSFVWVDKATGKADDLALEGSHFETENDYQILVYYRPPGARWEELIGYKLLNTAKK